MRIINSGLLALTCFQLLSCDSVIPYANDEAVVEEVVAIDTADFSVANEDEPPIPVIKKFALHMIDEDIKYDADYNAEYHFTVRNISDKTIVAFSIGRMSLPNNIRHIEEHKFKKTISPNNEYSDKYIIRKDSDNGLSNTALLDDMTKAGFDVTSVIFSDGTKLTHSYETGL